MSTVLPNLYALLNIEKMKKPKKQFKKLGLQRNSVLIMQLQQIASFDSEIYKRFIYRQFAFRQKFNNMG